jgi:hypothetical protein
MDMTEAEKRVEFALKIIEESANAKKIELRDKKAKDRIKELEKVAVNE